MGKKWFYVKINIISLLVYEPRKWDSRIYPVSVISMLVLQAGATPKFEVESISWSFWAQEKI